MVISGNGGKIEKNEWLAKDEACDIFFTGDGEKIRHRLYNSPHPNFDMIIQPVKERRKKLLVSDMDSTIITIECIDEIADFAGIKTQVAEITERAMNGELDFKESLRQRVNLLKGLDASVLQKVYDKRVRFMPGAKALVKTMRKNGTYCLLVSGGFTFFTSRVKDEVGFDEDHSNILDIVDGKLSGVVKEPVLDKDAKLNSLKTQAKKMNISESDVLAVGDGANDLPMLLAAGLGVAYHAKLKVKTTAKAKIDVCDLTALLYAQGYRKEEISF